jgi:SAM-dependent methyltransferase
MPLAGSRVRPADWGIDRRTIEVYERQAGDYARNRPPAHRERARLLAARCLPGLPVADLGCGPGGYASDLGATGAAVIGVDAARAMIALARDAERAVLGDLESLPLGLGVLGGAWARNSYLHVPPARLPLALAHLHHAMADGAPLVASVGAGEDFTSSDDLPGRAFFGWSASTSGYRPPGDTPFRTSWAPVCAC